MPNSCSAFLPNGINANCAVPLSEVEAVIFASATMEFASLTEAFSLAKWKDKIQKDLTIYVMGGMYDYEVTTADPNVLELPSTKKIITNSPVPSAKVYLEANFCDYQEVLRSLKQANYGVIYLLRDGSLLMRKNSVGKILPLTATLTAITKGVPLKGDIQNNYPVWINHKSYKEFEEAVLISPEWNAATEFITYMPVGLTAMTTSTVAAGVVSIQVNERCGDGYAGLLVADFEVVASNGLISPIVGVLVDNGLGSYTITLQKGVVPAAITAGDWMTIRIKKVAALVVTHLSNRLTIQA